MVITSMCLLIKCSINNGGVDNMEEKLVKLLKLLPHSYNGFVNGIMGYAKKNPERMKTVIDFIENNEKLTCSDVVLFVSSQPDFREDSVIAKTMVG